ncbi:hypothetical protein LRN22_004283 [Salmonella enterica]|nr:hypothetical protein [Salmonella enterica]EME7695732.1 hypothetical protein [Salmonella enterica]
MEIKKIFFMIAGPLIYTGICIPTINAAERADTQLNLRMEVAHITCLINDGAGINQQVYIPLASQDELRAGTAKSGLAKLLVDCSKSAVKPVAIKVNLIPEGGASVVGSGTDGILKTDLSGVALKVVWQSNGQPASLAIGNYTTFPASASDPLRWNVSLLVTPQYIQGEAIGKGNYKSALRVNVTYS